MGLYLYVALGAMKMRPRREEKERGYDRDRK